MTNKCRDLYQGARCCKTKGHIEKEHQANNGVTWPDGSQFSTFTDDLPNNVIDSTMEQNRLEEQVRRVQERAEIQTGA